MLDGVKTLARDYLPHLGTQEREGRQSESEREREREREEERDFTYDSCT